MLNFSWPKPFQWRQLFKIFTKKEKFAFFVLLFLFAASLVFSSTKFYLKNTEIMAAQGGTFIEGVVGQPQFINPLYLASNDADRELVELIFSGITKYDENGKLIYDLAKDIQVQDDGKIFRVSLKENIFWSDSSRTSPKPLTADDVIFTIKTIQNQKDIPVNLKANWTGVEVEKGGDLEVLFKLKNPYAGFLANLALKIIPQHIWQGTQNFPISSDYILNNPIGSGPFKLENLRKDGSGNINSITLVKNQNYYGNQPFISKIRFVFFKTKEDLLNSAKTGEINGFSIQAPEGQDVASWGFMTYTFPLPRYFAIFLNPQKSKVLSDLKIRQALNYGTDKSDIVKNILDSQGEIVDSPILPDIFGMAQPSKTYQYDLEKAKSLLEEAGFKENSQGLREKTTKKEPAFQFKSTLQKGSTGVEVKELQKCLAQFSDIYPSGEINGNFGDKTVAAVIAFQEKYAAEILKPAGLTKGTGSVSSATRKKLNELCAQPTEEKTTLSFTLITVSQPTMIAVANAIKEQWRQLGIEIKIQAIEDNTALESDFIKPRDYELLLFGEALQSIPDPFPFWHSIQTKDPGLNVALYENKEADKLLEEARQTLDEKARKENLEKFQNILIKDAPAVFLYSEDYTYFVSKNVKNIKEKMISYPSDRFSTVEKWYINEKRGWK
jgi:ABC-type transport system substrate-binding protein